MIPLPKTFRRDQFDYQQTQRSEDAAIYEQSKHGRVSTYEVILIRQQLAHTISRGDDQVELDEKELYPNSEQWGVSGWSYLTLKDARRKFYSLEPETAAA